MDLVIRVFTNGQMTEVRINCADSVEAEQIKASMWSIVGSNVALAVTIETPEAVG